MAEDRLAPVVDAGVNRIVSVAKASGYFGSVITHEPKSAPRDKLVMSTWVTHIKPLPLRSGLAVTSARLLMMARIYRNMLSEPQDEIDTEIAKAASYMLCAFTADFDLGPGIWVDLEGAMGIDCSAELGYIDLDKTTFRMAEITVPIIAEDVYTQEA